MKKYIDAEEFKNGVMEAMIEMSASDGALPMQIGLMLCGFADDAPAADVQEVKHGYWIEASGDRCSICGGYELGRTKYCPNCGAKMNE